MHERLKVEATFYLRDIYICHICIAATVTNVVYFACYSLYWRKIIILIVVSEPIAREEHRSFIRQYCTYQICVTTSSSIVNGKCVVPIRIAEIRK
jgi:hypothetical protein